MTRALAEQVGGFEPSSLPSDVLERSRHCLLDFIGCAIAGAGEESGWIASPRPARSAGVSESPLLARNGPFGITTAPKLPAQYEPRRKEIEAVLPALAA